MNGKLPKCELKRIKTLVTKIQSDNYRTELKEFLTNEQYPVSCSSNKSINDKLCDEIVHKVLVNVRETPNMSNEYDVMFFSNKHGHI